MTRSIFLRKRFYLGLGIAAVCLYFTFRGTDWSSLAVALGGAATRFPLLLAALAIYLGGYVVRGVRWHYLLAPVKRVPTVRLLPYLIIGFMANNVLPLRIGEFVRPYLAGQREGISRTASFATVVLERIFDGLTMLAILGVSSALLTTRADEAIEHAQFSIGGISAKDLYAYIRFGVQASAVLFIGLLVGAFLAITFRERTTKWAEIATRRLPPSLRDRSLHALHRFVSGLAILKSRTELFYAFALSLTAWGMEGAAYYLVAQAFGLPPSLPAVMMLMALVNLAIMIPSSPGGWGPFELVGVGVLRVLDVPEGVGKAYVLVIHSIIIFPITIWGLVAAGRLGLSLREIERSGESGEAASEKER